MFGSFFLLLINQADTKNVFHFNQVHNNFQRRQIQMLSILRRIRIQAICKWLWVHI